MYQMCTIFLFRLDKGPADMLFDEDIAGISRNILFKVSQEQTPYERTYVLAE